MTATAAAAERRRTAYGWLVWGLGAAFFGYAFFHRVMPSVTVDYLMRDFAVGAAIVGNLAACYFYAYAAMQLPVGIMLDRFGPRYLLVAGAAACAAGSFLFAGATDLWSAYAGRLLVGAGTGVIFVGSLTLAAIWLPPRRFALAVGLTQTVGMLGGIAVQVPLGRVVEEIGWRPTMHAAGFAAIGIGVAIWLVARGSARTGRPATAGAPTGRSATARAFANPQTWWVGLYSGCSSAPMIVFATLWGVPYLVQVAGFSRDAAAAGASTLLLGWALTAPFVGWASDRMGRRRPLLIVGMAVALVAWCVVLFLPRLPAPGIYAAIFLIGAASSVMALTFAVAREVNPPAVGGMMSGFVNVSSIIGAAALQPLIGWLLDRQWAGRMADGMRLFEAESFVTAFLVFPAMSAIGLLVALFTLRETHCRQVG